MRTVRQRRQSFEVYEGWLRLAGKSIKNAVGIEKYQSQHDEIDLLRQIGDAKMTFGIFDTERK